MKTIIQVKLENKENTSFKIKIVEIMALLKKAGLGGTGSTITN